MKLSKIKKLREISLAVTVVFTAALLREFRATSENTSKVVTKTDE